MTRKGKPVPSLTLPKGERLKHLADGAEVTVMADDDAKAFEVSPEEESELLEAIAGAERGETIRAADLLERLRR